MSKLFRFLSWFVVIALVVVADQVSKQVVLNHMQLGDSIPVIEGCFNWVLTYNRGAAFGFLSSAGGWQRYFLLAFAAGVSIWLLWMMWNALNRPTFCLAISLIVGGAVGNLIDRYSIGAVIDFIDWHVGSYHWPAFNVADIGISVGVTLLVLDAFLAMQKTSPRSVR